MNYRLARSATAILLALFVMLEPVVPAGAAEPSVSHGAQALIHLPTDDAMHAAASTEWWYVVGHLHDAAGHTYGYETVMFRFSHLRAAVPSLPFDVVYRADVAFTDEGSHTFSGAPRYVRPSGATTMSRSLLEVRAGPLAMNRVASQPVLTYSVRETAPDGTRLDLVLRAAKPALLVGGSGLIPMGKRGSSYYYSLPNLQTRGTIQQHGQGRPRAVSGISWMDHQWGVWDWSGINGWDWMAVQLAGNLQLNITDSVGGRGSPHKAATISLPTGRQTLSLHMLMTPLGRWRSPRTHITYPSGWRLRDPDLGLDVVVRPAVLGQEMTDRFAPDQSYWEGSCIVSGTLRGRPITGRAYTELAGYGAPNSAATAPPY
jgi:predicted secreted hydrolase